MHNPRKEHNSVNNCNYRFQTEMATKRQNLWTAALSKDAFNLTKVAVKIFIMFQTILFQINAVLFNFLFIKEF